MKSVGPPSRVTGKAEVGSKTHITEPTLLQRLVLLLYAAKHRQQKLDGEVVPPGLLGTEPPQRHLAVNIKVGSKSSNSALKRREASHGD